MDQAMQTVGLRKLPSLEDSLRLGQSFHLEFEGLPALNGGYHLWGVCPNQSIMVSAPQLELTTQLLNTAVKARLFIEQFDSACAFRTTVSNVCANPSVYLHLAMPEVMVTGEVRRTDRVKISLPCELKYTHSSKAEIENITTCFVDETEQSVHKVSGAEILDASINGCRINTFASDLRVGDTITMVFDIDIFDVHQTLELTAMVRSRRATGTGYSLGAQFLEMNDNHRITLSSYLQKHR